MNIQKTKVTLYVFALSTSMEAKKVGVFHKMKKIRGAYTELEYARELRYVRVMESSNYRE